MTEAVPVPAPEPETPEKDRTRILVVVLTVLTTLITTLVAGLQADANSRAAGSNRDSQVLAIQASGELHRLALQSAYDMNVFAAYLKDSQESTVLQLTALQQQQKGQAAAAADSQLQAGVAQARADTAQKFSIFFNDSRYAPTSAGAMPDMSAYVTDSYAAANALVAQQNAASAAYDRWNRKGGAYTSILAILAVTFFLFGLAEALAARLRLLIAAFGLVALAIASLWTLIVLLG